ncbi:MAG: cell division ATP-binding protein FtsE [Paracoccaceae bacterium]
MIELDQVAYSYGGGDLLTDVSLSLTEGSFHFVTGPSEAGKTTFLKLCYGALRPTSGHVRLFAQDQKTMDRDALAKCRRRIGVVHQNCQFLDHLSVAENVALPLTVQGLFNDVAQADLNDLLNWVSLSHRADAMPAQLSGGERQRAALARAIITRPDVILADEPTGNVDPDMSKRLMNLLGALNRMGNTVVIATHDMGLIRVAKTQVQARVLRIAGGHVQTGTEL